MITTVGVTYNCTCILYEIVLVYEEDMITSVGVRSQSGKSPCQCQS
jgi:hypothetical protein